MEMQTVSPGKKQTNFSSLGDWLLALGILAGLLLAYGPAIAGTPVWDDKAHLTQPELRHGLGSGEFGFSSEPRSSIIRLRIRRSG